MMMSLSEPMITEKFFWTIKIEDKEYGHREILNEFGSMYDLQFRSLVGIVNVGFSYWCDLRLGLFMAASVIKNMVDDTLLHQIRYGR